ncbi:MAG: hypothetical protein ACRC6U_06830 [Fusobacteriaceae bacterium]
MKEILNFLKETKNSKYNDLLACLELKKDILDEIRDKVAHENIPEIAKLGDMEKMTNIMNIMSQLKEKSELIDEVLENNLDIEDKFEEIEKTTSKDYEKYRVNEKVEHNLYGSFTFKRPCAIRIENKKIEINNWKEVLINTCEYLVHKDKKIFLDIIINKKITGRKRELVSSSKDNLRDPKYIKEVNGYIETNLNADGIKNIIKRLLKEYKIPIKNYGVFLRADYTDLNNQK